MNEIKVKQLGLAAFIKMQGARLVSVTDGLFVFDSDVSLSDWRVRYANSCCMEHDALVCELRHSLKSQ